jgi:hypothetical protein
VYRGKHAVRPPYFYINLVGALQSLMREDLLVAAKILDKAFDRIVELQGRG